MLHEFSDKLYQPLELELEVIAEHHTAPIDKITVALKKVLSALYALREYLHEHPFTDIQQEILFFKEIKPKYLCLYIFHQERYKIQTTAPVGSKKTIKKYYEEELLFIRRFFERHAFEYQYYKLNATEMDERLFVRGRFPAVSLFPEIAEIDPLFSSSHDYLFSKIKAFERLQKFLTQVISNLENVQAEIPVEKNKKLRQPTKFNLSVDQLGLCARAADDARLIIGKSFNAICEELAPYLSSNEKERISAGSLRSNAYTGENTDKLTLIHLLEKMIWFIKGY